MNKYLLLSLLIGINSISFSQIGQLDPAYDHDGIQTSSFLKGNVQSESGQKLLQQADGKILAVISLSFSQGMVARFLSNGTLDATYGTGGFSRIIDVGFKDAKLQSDGKLVAVGNAYTADGDFGVVRFKTNGQVDSSFGINGKRITDFGTYEFTFGVAIQADGKIVVVGGANEDFALARYTTTGAPDNTFSGDGKQTTDFGFFDEAHAVAIQPDGKIVVAGMVSHDIHAGSQDFGIVRYTTTGIPDNTFSGDGKQTTNFGFDDNALAVAIQADGKIVAAGVNFVSGDIAADGNFALARYTSAGLPDNTFSGDGRQSSDFSGDHDAAFAIALQTDGKLVVAGIATNVTQNYGVVRYLTNGNPDPTFSGDGKQQKDFGFYDAAYSVLVQTDGKVLLAGEVFNDSDYDLGLVRYTTTGNPDTQFSGDGLALSFLPTDAPVRFTSGALQADGKLLVAGIIQHKVAGSAGNIDFAVARFLPSGAPDNSFDFNGKLTTDLGNNDVASAIAVQSDGKIVVAGESNGRIAITRYLSNGALDNTFNGNGRVLTNLGSYAFTTSMVIQPGGKIVVAGGLISPTTDMSDFVVLRYNSNGTPDNTFSGDGRTTTNFGANDQANALALQSDGKILAVGSSQDSTLTTYFALARYTTTGTPDNTFSGDGRQIKNFLLGWQDDAKSVALQADGKIVVAGALRTELSTSFLLARYNTNGNLDNTFSGDGLLPIDFSGQGEASSIVIQPDGKPIAGGFSNAQFALARVRVDGTLDPGFATGGKQLTTIPGISASINDLVLAGQRLYAVGGSNYSGAPGVTAAYQLGSVAAMLPAQIAAANDQVDEMSGNRKGFSASASPTPASAFFTIRTYTNREGSVALRVVDVMGKLVEQRRMPGNSSIDIGHQYRSGVYFMQLMQGNEKIVLRCIKQGK